MLKYLKKNNHFCKYIKLKYNFFCQSFIPPSKFYFFPDKKIIPPSKFYFFPDKKNNKKIKAFITKFVEMSYFMFTIEG